MRRDGKMDVQIGISKGGYAGRLDVIAVPDRTPTAVGCGKGRGQPAAHTKSRIVPRLAIALTSPNRQRLLPKLFFREQILLVGAIQCNLFHVAVQYSAPS
jgi:hypothetical protein